MPIVPDRIKPDPLKPVLLSVNVDMRLLYDTVAAIGCKLASVGRGSSAGEHFPRLIFGNANKDGMMIEPLIIEPANSKIYQHYFPPYGLVMPMHFKISGNDLDPGNYWKQAG